MINEHCLYENWLSGHKAGVLDAVPHGVKWFKSQVDEIRANHIQHQLKADTIHATVSRLGNGRIIQVDQDGSVVGSFATIAEAAKETGVCATAISNTVAERCKTASGFQWSRI